jgi:hypothetical protein
MTETKSDQIWNVAKLAGIAAISLGLNHLISTHLNNKHKNIKTHSKV